MGLNNYCIVVTGLPGSGKSTLGIEVAKYFELPYFDKDDYLERLFVERGIGGSGWRHVLSRKADEQFIKDSIATNEAVLVSHWRPMGLGVDFGTPAEWIAGSFDKVVELYCDCSVELAATRFINRNRHKGHADKSKSIDEVIDWLRGYEKHLPMSFGHKVVVDSTGSSCFQAVKEEIADALRNNA